MLMMKIVIDLICAALYTIGGQFFIESRRFIMPFVLGCAIAYVCHCWWLGLTIYPIMGWLCVGYGSKSWLRALLGDAGARGMWLFMACTIIAIPLVILHHFTLWFAIPYVILAGVLGATLRGINDLIGDPIFGAWISSVVFFVH